jgi:hypothetical protein
VCCLLAAMAVPGIRGAVHRPEAQAAARYLAGRMVRARTRAVMGAAAVALRFQSDAAGFTIADYVDGNRNGVRTSDITAGVDRLVQDARHLPELFPRVRIAFSQDGADLDPVQIGSTTLMSFTPAGTATSGSIYVRGADGSQYVVRVLGATGRVRVARYDPSARVWVEGL